MEVYTYVSTAISPLLTVDLRFVEHSQEVLDLYQRASDYVLLETGLAPDQATVEDFFFDFPPGGALEQSFKLGLFTHAGHLAGIADLGFGFPKKHDAYIGLLLIEPAHRGMGAGRLMINELEARARLRGADRLLVAVLDENTKGRDFWEREGFEHILSSPPMETGHKTHIRHRLARKISKLETAIHK